jgi:NADPH-dependent 2,4-dienoyl-CoA reductase/sulfur reductase-like enzyme/rhodanese-related sulfurtransferase
MEGKQNIVIIGGGACGPKAAARLRRLDAGSQITMIQDELYISYAACGLPYYIEGMVKSRDDLLVRDAAAFKRISNVDVLEGTRVDSIDRAGHKIQVTDLKNGTSRTLPYDKLVIATGAEPVFPPLKGIDLKGVHVLKRIPDADEIISLVSGSTLKKAVIIGAGLIGMEMAETLVYKGFQVTIVEALERVLPALLDSEISDLLAKYLKEKGIVLKLGQKIVSFEGINGRVNSAKTDKENLDADLVIFSIGVRPNSKLAKEAGLEIGPFGDITVNDHLRTSDPDIYAGGDCVANKNIVTGKKMMVPLGSTANKHGHVIAGNISGENLIFPGIVASACAKTFDFSIGRVGLGEKQAEEAGFKVVSALIPGRDKPEYYPDSKDITIKLIVDVETHRILGGQGTGPGELIKRMDVLVTAITMGMTVDTLANLDLCYSPPFNGALDILHHLANLVLNKIEGKIESLKPAEVKEKIDSKEDFVLLDVRSKGEWRDARIDAPQCQLLPQPKLREGMQDLPKDKEIVVMCQRGVRAYNAACTLRVEGFTDAKFMEGSLSCWCDDVYCEMKP